jgi:Domain of unknown function (DUF4442)
MTNWSQTQAQKTITQLTNPFKFWLFKWTMLPSAGFMGLSMKSLDATQCQIGLKYGWRSKNPFKSIYFAAQCAAGELATGAVATVVSNGFDQKILMLVTHVEAEFTKKAVGNITFTCNEGNAMIGTIQDGILNNEARQYRATAIGIDQQGDVVSKVYLTWSFKAKSK